MPQERFVEPLLTSDNTRFTQLPINYEKLRSDVEFLKNEYAKEKIKKIKKKLSKRSKNKYVYNIPG